MLTTRMQIQALADRLAGLPVKADPASFTDPWRACWLALDRAAPGNPDAGLLEALRDRPERDWVLSEILSACPGDRPGDCLSLAELSRTLPPLEWIWPGWIPRGMITLLGSAPGVGKSYLALDLARRLIHGEAFPDGAPCPGAGRPVVYVDAEDVPLLLNQRALAWNMDTNRIYPMLPEPGQMIDFGLGRCRDRLLEVTAALQPELIVVDSLSCITSKGENNVEDVRLVLGFLNQLAQEARAGLLLLHHLKKASSPQTRGWDLSIDDFRGSSHIIATARSVIGLSVVQCGPTPDRNGPRKLEIIKTNLGPYPEPLGFEMAPLHPSGVLLRWGAAPRRYRELSDLDGCSAWLEALLRGAVQQGSEALKPAWIIEQGKAEGYSRTQIYRARELLGAAVGDTLKPRHRDNAWVWVGEAEK